VLHPSETLSILFFNSQVKFYFESNKLATLDMAFELNGGIFLEENDELDLK